MNPAISLTAKVLPLAATGLLWLTGARLGRLLPPATAVRLLTVVALAAALATGFMLSVAAFLALAQIPHLAAQGQWSVTALRAGDQVPVIVGVPAGILVSMLLAAAARHAVRAGRDVATAALACRRLSPAAGRLVVVEDDQPAAYALPGIHGRIIVTTTMLQALPADERRVLLAHEAAHLTHHHHHLYIQTAELAAAANPLLRPLARAICAAAERWADETAAAEVGDRRLAARALARAGLAHATATGARRTPRASLAAAETHLTDRIRALLNPPPRRRTGLASALVATVLITAASAALTAHQTERQFELAHAEFTHQR